jgi:2-iminobutanoate/2-iminopropanoate deaminase
MTSRQPVASDQAPPPTGTYSSALVHERLLYVSGQTPRRSDGTRLNARPFTEQARQALENVEQLAHAAGTTLRNGLSVTVFLADPEDRFAFDEIWAEYVAPPYPTRAIVPSTLPGFALEIQAVIAL